MEYRIVLTNKEAAELSDQLIFGEFGFVKDEYTGEKRIRTDSEGIREKEYKIPIKGIVYRFSTKCKLDGIDVWFESKWTDKKSRFELEFEGEVPEKFKKRQNITGWDILI